MATSGLRMRTLKYYSAFSTEAFAKSTAGIQMEIDYSTVLNFFKFGAI
jgi:hypothetical protein